jgi:hypothetical protein
LKVRLESRFDVCRKRQDQRGKREATVAGAAVVVVIGNNAADTESVVSKEDIHVLHRMVADRTYSEDETVTDLETIRELRMN